MKIYNCETVNEVEQILKTIENKKYNFIDVIQGELGCILMILNSFGKHFVKNVGLNNVCICNTGHSYFYKDYASIIIEFNFINNTSIKQDKKLIASNGSTDKYYNHRKISNSAWQNLMNKYKTKWGTVFEGIYHPNDEEQKNGKRRPYNIYGKIEYMQTQIIKYTSGEKILTYTTGNRNNFNDPNNLYTIRSNNCKKDNDVIKKEYITIHARKGYKNKQHNFNEKILFSLIDLFQKNNIKVIIFEDIFKFNYPNEFKNELLEIIDMSDYFDVEKYINICKYSRIHFGTQTGANEINLYYNSIHFVNCDKDSSSLTIKDYSNMCLKKGRKFYHIWKLNKNELLELYNY